MNYVVVIAIIIAIVALFYFFGDKISRSSALIIYKKSLATSKCPQCGITVGSDEAAAAYERIRAQMNEAEFNRFGPDGLNHWPVICPHCGASCNYWISDKVLEVTSKDDR